MMSRILGAPLFALAPLALVACSVAGASPDAPVSASATTAVTDPVAAAWGYANSDVPPDPSVRYGVLPNGMKYALMHNETPKDSVAIRMAFDVGSLEEADDQRGLAHFLEHMAFNGSTNVPEGEMVKLLERKGLAFGADTNASTGFETTTYKLDLPKPTDDLIDTGLMLMRETSSELTLDPASIDRERGVILGERRARDTYGLRNVVDLLEFAAKGTLFPHRLPIGTPEILTTFPASRMREFYDHYYRPERATLVLVGDFDIDAVEAKIKSRFTDWKGRGEPGKDADIGKPDFAAASAADIYVDPALDETVSVMYRRPWTLRPDTWAENRRQLIRDVGVAIVNKRLSDIVLSGKSPLNSASVSFGDFFGADMMEVAMLSATTKEGGWKDGMSVVENEFRRARQFGFTDAEFAEQMANRRTAFENSAANASTRNSRGLAEFLVSTSKADGRSVFATPQANLDWFNRTSPGITLDDVNKGFNAEMDGMGQPLIRVTAKKPIGSNEQAVLSAFGAAQQVAVTAPAKAAAGTFAYTNFGTPGKIISDRRIEDLGIREIRFSNNVMLNIKQTDFEKDRVRMSVRVDGGDLLNTRANPNNVALSSFLTLGGLEKHSFTDLRTLLAGKTVSTTFGSDEDSFGGNVTTTPRDFELQSQLLTAFITSPGYREEGVALFRRILPDAYAKMDATPEAVLQRDVQGIVTNNDPRFITQPLETMMTLDFPPLKAAMADSLSKGAIEIGVVGDIDEQVAIDIVAKTFGALPERRAAFAKREEARTIDFAKDRSTRTLIHQGPADQAVVRSYWHATDDRDPMTQLKINLLTQIMDIMLTDKLREELGVTYSPQAGANMSSTYRNWGLIFVSSNVDYKNIEATERAIDAVTAQLMASPVSEDIFNRARNPLLESMAKSRRENGWWLARVGEAQFRPELLDRARQSIPAMEKLTPSDIQAVAKLYLRPDRQIRIRAVSANAGK